nr:SDR family NAD(P)-dependent oxidoreductase [Pseudomonas zeshuii]
MASVAGGTGDSAIPLVIDLLNPESCASLLPSDLEKVGQLDIFYANAGSYIGGDLLEANSAGIDCMPNLNVNAVMKNVHDVLPHMIERGTGNIVVNGQLQAISRCPGSRSMPCPSGR